MAIQIIYTWSISSKGDQNFDFLYTKLLASIEDKSIVCDSSLNYLLTAVYTYLRYNIP